ncbi:hypothetical protein N6H14_06745 [Paenibacillus sp. CC-CFT747]|nr:hypothetical protein N6H14_06745 [Paenibacillus sp. CC-CFT747]
MTTNGPDMPVIPSEEGKSLSVYMPEEFSWDETLHYLTRSPAECLHQVEGRSVYKLLEFRGNPGWCGCRSKGKEPWS